MWLHMQSVEYWLVFVASFLAVAVWESLRPRVDLHSSPSRRWSRHGIVLTVTSGLSFLLYRANPVIAALAVARTRFGFFNHVRWPFPLVFVLTILVLDFTVYAIHWCYHHVPFLWPLHRLHHSDPDVDVSTGVRSHPFEVLLNQLVMLAVISLLAAPPSAVLTVQLLAAAQTFISHANASMPKWIDAPLRRIFVTPVMHRIHHSEEVPEQSMNLGDLFPWWDRVFRTYLAEPAAGDDGLVVGIKGWQNDASLNLSHLLLQPFLHAPEETASPASPANAATPIAVQNPD